MIKGTLTLIILILLINFISCSCNSTQININTASLEELDKIINVGIVIAQRIINNRTYNSLDDLIRVSGIGEITLNEIKLQGLACVEEVKDEKEEEISNESTASEITPNNENENNIEDLNDEENIENIAKTEILKEENIEEEKIKILNLSPIIINSKDIKSEEDKEILKRKLSFYGIITFGVIFSIWFLITRKKNKNEFR